MINRLLHLFVCAIIAFSMCGKLCAQGTAFTYQGQLGDNGVAANGFYDFRFSIFDSTNNPGILIAGPVTNSTVAVSNGLFTAQMDFGSGVFNGLDRWLQIAVRTNGATVFTNLTPRQKLTPVPYAIFANTASNLMGSLDASQLIGTLPASVFTGFTNTVALTNGANLFSGTFSGNGTNLSNLNASQLTGGTVADARLSTNVALLNTNQTFTGSNNFTGIIRSTGTNTFNGVNTFTNFGNSFSGSFFGNGLVGWIATNGTAVQAEIDHGYLLTNSQLATVTLPTAPNVGDIVRVSGAGASGWKIAQNAGQGIIGNFLSFVNSLWTASDAGSFQWESIAASSDGTQMIAAASGKGLYISYNSGAHWSSVDVNTFQWRAVASSSDGSKLYAAVFGGSMYTNSGTSFTAAGSAGSRNWVSIACSSDGSKAVAIVNGGGLYTTSNSGATWIQRTTGLPTNPNWFSVASSSDGADLIVCVDGGNIYTSSNAGVSWAQSGDSPSSTAWTSVASSDDGSKLAATITSGKIYTSANSGANWTQRTGVPNANWETIVSSSDGSKLAAVANLGGIYVSGDYGSTWTQAHATNGAAWFSLASSSDGGKLAAGILNGTIYTSQLSPQSASTTGTSGFIFGSQGSAVELQYIGAGKFMPVSSAGTIWAN